jgi:subtilisin family serine protease
VAVIDTGVDTGHPDLRGRMWTNAAEAGGARGVDDDRNGCVDDVHGCDFYHRLEGRLPDGGVFDRADGEVHGTHVAGTIAATAGNQAGVAGVAPGARIMSLKVLGADGYGDTSDILEALDYARRMRATVVNMSLGATLPPGASAEQAREFRAAIDAERTAIARTGLPVVVSAGNDAVSDDDPRTASYPAALDLPNIVSVAAVDHRGRLAAYSNWGPRSVDLGAPGTSVLSTVPRQPQVVAATSTAVGTKRGRIMTWGFGLEDVTLETRRAHLLGRSLAALGASTSSPILLVQDDEHDLAPLTGGLYFRDAGSLYRSALAAVGYRNVTVVRVPAGRPGPTAAQMAGRFVVWQTGQGFGAARDALTSTLQPRDVEALAANAAAGGRVLLAGAEALYEHPDLATAPTVARFVRDVLRVAVAVDGVLQVHAGGGPGNFALSPGAHPYRDGLRPLTTAASPWLTYPATDYAYLSGTSMAAPHVSGIAALAAARAPGLRGTALAQHVARSSRLHWPLTGRTVSSGLASAEIATR